MTSPRPCRRCGGRGYDWTKPVGTISPAMAYYQRARCPKCDGGGCAVERVTKRFPAVLPPHPTMRAVEDEHGWSTAQLSGEILQAREDEPSLPSK